MDKFSFKILKLFMSRNSLDLSQLSAILNMDALDIAETINYLRDKNYLEIEHLHAGLNGIEQDDLITFHTPLAITFQGKVAVEQEESSLKKYKHQEFRLWLTLAIAIASFIKSFFF